MSLVAPSPAFRFMRYRRHAVAFSVVTTLVSIGSFAWQGLNLGLDFTGGTVAELHYAGAADLELVRARLAAAGIESAQVQSIGTASDVLIRQPPGPGIDQATVQADLIEALGGYKEGFEIRRFETVGPQVGEDLAEQGGIAMLFALVGIFAYVMLRFRWKFAVGTIVATLHDAIVTIGVFSLFRWEFNLTVLGAVLAVVGYSVNDTIVVYDRIRDNFGLMRRASPEQIVDASVNQTLSRTIVTGLTTLLVLFALLVLGGETLWGFSVALIIGIVVGTYSSIYVASAMALALSVRSGDFVPRQPGPLDQAP